MTTAEIIEKIPTLKLEPKSTKCIGIYVKEESNYYNLSKAVTMDSCVDSVIIYPDRKKGNQLKGIYYEFIPEIKSVACMLCNFDLRMPVKKEPVKWKVIDVFFITEKKELITKYGDEWYVFTDNIIEHLPFTLYNHPIYSAGYYQYNEYINGNLTKEFSKLFPVIHLKGSITKVLSTPTDLMEFLKHKEQVPKSGPKQKLINELTSIEIPDPILPDIDKPSSRRKDTFVQIVKVNPNVACLRWIRKDHSLNTQYETIRLYVDKKSSIGCKKNNNNQYVQFRLSAGKHNFTSGNILPFEKSDLNGTLLQYFSDIFEEIPTNKQSLFIWMFLQYPIVEKLYRSELKDIILEMANSYQTPMDFLNSLFGTVNPKLKSLFKCLGINKYQLKRYIEEKNDDNRSIIKNIKEIFSCENIDFIDNNTFDVIFDNLKKVNANNNKYCVYPCLTLINRLYSTKTLITLCPQIVELGADTTFIRLYRDYLNMVEKLDDTKNYRPNFTSTEDVKKMHDAALAVYNLKKEVLKRESFEKHCKKWDKFTYSNEIYSVISPKTPGDIAKEGLELHHCVRSYIDKVVIGDTNILFIRKTEDLDKPFFTVEISNSGIIEQVHGFGNRNVNTEPGLDVFIKEWTKNKKLKTYNINKVR